MTNYLRLLFTAVVETHYDLDCKKWHEKQRYDRDNVKSDNELCILRIHIFIAFPNLIPHRLSTVTILFIDRMVEPT